MEVTQKAAAITAAASATASAGMADVSLALFGVSMAVVLAAFAGAMISLTFLPGRGPVRAIFTVVSGTVAGAYLSPLVLKVAGWLFPGIPELSDNLDKPVAFLLGLGFQLAVPVFYDKISILGKRKEGS